MSVKRTLEDYIVAAMCCDVNDYYDSPPGFQLTKLRGNALIAASPSKFYIEWAYRKLKKLKYKVNILKENRLLITKYGQYIQKEDREIIANEVLNYLNKRKLSFI